MAAVGHALLTTESIFNTQAYAAVPFTRSWGGFELTLGPRAYLPDLRSTSVTVGPLNAGSFGVGQYPGDLEATNLLSTTARYVW